MLRKFAMLSMTLGALSCGQLFNVGEHNQGNKDSLNPGGGAQCGAVTCGVGLECCNASCGTCVPPGGACTQQYCEPVEGVDAGQCGGRAMCAIACQYGFEVDADGCELCQCRPAPDAGSGGVACGASTCGAGEECCNSSCGTCVPHGGACTQQYCEPVGDADAGQCSGVVCSVYCEYGHQLGADGCEICACNPAPVNQQCGDSVCGAGLECCNPSCGICVPPGGACTQQYCPPVGGADAGA